MWNNFAELIKDPSLKRLAAALVVSAILHAMMFGGLDLSLPVFKKEMHVIEARIQMPKSVVKQETPVKPEPKVAQPAVKKSTKPTSQPIKAPKIEENTEAPVSEKTAEPISPSIENSTPPENQEPKSDPEQTQQPEDAGLVINENAYQYVETYFDVRTKIDGPVEGKGKTIFNLMDKEHYQLSFLIEAQGLTAVFLPDLTQTSEGFLTKTGLQPATYLYQFGNKTDRTRKAVFDWQANTVQLITSKETRTEPLLEGTQDVLSFMYQFMYVAPLQKMQLNITNGKKLREYDYAFEGEENVNSSLGEVKTYHIAHTGTDTDEKIELWLAIDYQFIPVKIRKIEKDGKLYEFLATRIVTTRPVLDR